MFIANLSTVNYMLMRLNSCVSLEEEYYVSCLVVAAGNCYLFDSSFFSFSLMGHSMQVSFAVDGILLSAALSILKALLEVFSFVIASSGLVLMSSLFQVVRF